MESKGNLPIGQGRDRVGRSPAADLFGVRDSSLETLHASVMCLVAAPGTPGQHAAASYRGRGGAGEDEGPAAEGEPHPELGYCRANHPPATPQPPGPESTSRKSGESPYAASHRTREQGLYQHVVVDAAQEANVMVSGSGAWDMVSWFLFHLFPSSLVLVMTSSQVQLPTCSLTRDLFSIFLSCNNPKLMTDK